MKRFTTLLASTAIIATMAAPAAFAQDDELSQLEATVQAELVALEITGVDFDELTIGEVAAIKNILEEDMSEAEKTRRIEEIVGTEMSIRTRTADVVYVYPRSLVEMRGMSSLEQVVANDLAGLGIEADVGDLTVNQLAEIKAVLESDEARNEKRRQVEAILAS